jgi:hypothetical protein
LPFSERTIAIIGVAIPSCREAETPMAGKNSLLEDLYADSGGFDAKRPTRR